ncbi:MAG: aldo/keto reductase [Coriobacteriales bacterium]|jgi:predicted aldo/keto reductase-like oxidoreductase|nr:aldo/keto reductase [Coriobacteriales bacterium]
MKEYFGKPISKLGFGLMRLPFFGKSDSSPLDIDQITQMADLFLQHGFSYFDTAYAYHGGQSEVAFREAVSSRYPRDAFQITTKLPLWRPLNHDEMREITNESLTRLGVDFFDLYFLHSVGPDRFEMLEQIKAFDYLQSLKTEGITKNVGFSYHGDPESLGRLLDSFTPGFIDIVQLQINYFDWENPEVQSRRLYETVYERGIGIIIMEPVKGGLLADFDPDVAQILKQVDPQASLSSWALRFVLELPGVVCVLSGMSNIDHVIDNIKTAESYTPLTDSNKDLLQAVISGLAALPTIDCTDCRYCVDDCPQHINTPRIIQILNDYTKYRNLPSSRRQYGFATGGGFGGGGSPTGKSSDCEECRTCEEHCPQDLDIVGAHKQAAELFE